ncbi:NAD-dependent epimerase/dehydratase family protein [Muricauda sp. CAU 1633]|uniref:NAD-dependent epimerase/dehydratase family protein n=1 Tax=Allomuricauda sp. CAU 1633 TaxID=2816036 RepID=UPI001A8BFF7F|nr:NAD-dependent epimerase/dehydratase family protein [Muricauda sp. CAU 1633]MBO0322913.1 NAD-dependent epimerase/dehydratase family protein [Muricauda sp. CAU 1633]
MQRRFFLEQVGWGLSSILVTSVLGCARAKSNPKKLLVLGGTVFLGPSIVKAGIKAGFDITLFNRGVSNPDLFPNLRLIKGDRTIGQKVYRDLINEDWDVVIDVWPEKSYMVDDATMALQNRCKHYTFVSSIAVYDNFQTAGLNENSKVFEPRNDKGKWEYYEEKVHAERLVRKRFPDNHTILRPGPIKGWRDSEMDLAYWLARIKKGGKVLAPGNGNDPIQFIDVTDVGSFAIKCIERGLTGTFNTTGPQRKLIWKDFLEQCRAHYNPNTEFVWVDETFLRKKGVLSMRDLPLWAPMSEDLGFMQINNAKAVEHGLDFTDIHRTFDDTMEWVEQISKTKSDKMDLFANAISFESEIEILNEYLLFNKERQNP